MPFKCDKRLSLFNSVALGNMSGKALAVKLNSIYADVDKKLCAAVKVKSYGVMCVKKCSDSSVSRNDHLALGGFNCCAKSQNALCKCGVGNVRLWL